MIIIILGESGAGKDAIVNQVSKDLGIPVSVSFTTRDKRPGEIDGVTYNYLTDREFSLKLINNEVIEYTEYQIGSENRTYKYGVTRDQLTKGENVLVILNPIGFDQLMRTDLKDNILSIYIKATPRTRLLRALSRDENANVDEIVDRFIRDIRDFRENPRRYNYTINNEDGELESTIKAIEFLIKTEILKRERD